MLDPVVKHKIEHALLIVKGPEQICHQVFQSALCLSEGRRRHKGSAFSFAPHRRKITKQKLLLLLLYMLVPKVCTKYNQAENQLIYYIDILVLEAFYGNIHKVHVLIYVYKYLHSSIYALGFKHWCHLPQCRQRTYLCAHLTSFQLKCISPEGNWVTWCMLQYDH